VAHQQFALVPPLGALEISQFLALLMQAPRLILIFQILTSSSLGWLLLVMHPPSFSGQI
jgi:hypothetical protein